MTRFAKEHRVIFWEEPVDGPEGSTPRLEVRAWPDSGVVVVKPVLPQGLAQEARDEALRGLLDGLLASEPADLVRWYCTPMMLTFSRHLDAICTVYDCMDELANLRFAPPELTALERELMEAADVVFTGGYSLWEAKRGRHANIHPFPSGVDCEHFAEARLLREEPHGDLEAVKIAATPDEFVAACDQARSRLKGDWLTAVDGALAAPSWDEIFTRMSLEISRVVARGGAGVASDAIGAPAVRPASRNRPFDYLIVGAGFAGSVLAERLASQLGKRVLLVDRRSHVGGIAYDEKDAAGVLMHRYGPHIFHTNSDEVSGYLSQFTKWRAYEHRVLASVNGGLLVPMPINRTTLNTIYDLDLSTDQEAEAFLASRAEPVEKIRTSEDVVVSKVGRELYEKFFRGYTRKQWGMDPSELDKAVTARAPIRTNADDRYFTDRFQAMPAEGYTRMFENMLDQKGITLELGVDFEDAREDAVYDQLIFSGPIDDYFDHRYGKLPYRSIAFRHETLDREWFQPAGVVTYPDEATPYTRISEYKHFTGQSIDKTTITYEYPGADGDPYYPVPKPENQALYKRYEALALEAPNVQFVGRLATYRYSNMDQVVGQSLATFRRIAEREGRTVIAAQSAARAIAAS